MQPDLALLEVKSFDDEKRLIRGYATLWGVEDRQGETMTRSAVEPFLGDYLKNGRLLWEHGADPDVGPRPIGKVLKAIADEVGLLIEARIYKGNKYVDYAWNYIKEGVRGLSLGALRSAVEKMGSVIRKWPTAEISVTAGPAVDGAIFSLAKMLAFAKSVGPDFELDPQLLRISNLLASAEEGAQQTGSAQALWSKAVTAMGKALERDDIKRVETIYTETEKETTKMTNEEIMALAKKAVQDEMEAAKAAQVKADQDKADYEKAVNDAAETKAADILAATAAANPAAKRALFPETDEAEKAEKSTSKLHSFRGPYDDMEAVDLGLAFMVAKSVRPYTGNGPSQDLYRATHAATVKAIESGRWSTKTVMPDMVGKSEMSWSKRVKPTMFSSKKDHALWSFLRKNAPDQLWTKADELMGSDVTDQGDEWIPEMFSRELIPLIRNEAMVQNLFRAIEVPGESLTLPTEEGSVTFYKVAQADDVAELSYGNAYISGRTSQVETGNVTLTPKKMGAMLIWTGEMNEQALVAQAPYYRQAFVNRGREVIDELLISGDTDTATTNISDTGNGAIASTWRLLVLNGLRDIAIGGSNSASVGTMAIEDFISVKKTMGTNGKNALLPSKLVWIMDPAMYFQAQTLGEVLTVDKYAAAATIVQGVLDRIYGSPVIPSDQYSLTDSSGKIHTTGGNNTLGSFLCVRPDQGMVGWGRRMSIETQRIARADAFEVVSFMELDFAMATADAVGLGYNATVS
jgi:HK97 family phage major capsid protein